MPTSPGRRPSSTPTRRSCAASSATSPARSTTSCATSNEPSTRLPQPLDKQKGVRGTSMTSETVAALLSDLEVTRSHSRPKVSNDNPYSEAWFKTSKYSPTFPERFGCLADARGFLDDIVQWYNHQHAHTGIGLHKPADVHYGLAAAEATQRAASLTIPSAATPERFNSTIPPKILQLPEAAWINPPLLPAEPAA